MTNSRCPFYRGVRLTEVAVKRVDLLVSKVSVLGRVDFISL